MISRIEIHIGMRLPNVGGFCGIFEGASVFEILVPRSRFGFSPRSSTLLPKRKVNKPVGKVFKIHSKWTRNHNKRVDDQNGNRMGTLLDQPKQVLRSWVPAQSTRWLCRCAVRAPTRSLHPNSNEGTCGWFVRGIGTRDSIETESQHLISGFMPCKMNTLNITSFHVGYLCILCGTKF